MFNDCTAVNILSLKYFFRNRYNISFIFPSPQDSDTTEAIALYDYKGRTEKEITFKKGDKLTIKGQLSADWWLGAIDTNNNNNNSVNNILLKYGYIPDKYIALRSKNR